jgi:hypothetical protein
VACFRAESRHSRGGTKETVGIAGVRGRELKPCPPEYEGPRCSEEDTEEGASAREHTLISS